MARVPERRTGCYSYSQFAEHCRRWRATLDLVLRQEYRADGRAFVDYAGLTVDIVDPTTGEVRSTQIFVAALGASNYTYAEATWTQQSPGLDRVGRPYVGFFLAW